MSNVIDIGFKPTVAERKVPMRYKTVTITKVENNGYLVSCITPRPGTNPMQEDFVFMDFESVILWLKPDSLKLAS